MRKSSVVSLVHQAFFFVLMMTVMVGTVALCMIGSNSVLAYFHALPFWRRWLVMPLTVCLIGIVFGTGLYLQGKYAVVQERKRRTRATK